MNNKCGFTLVEVLVAASLFLGLISAVGYSYHAAQQGLASAESRAGRLDELRSELEELRPLPFDSLAGMNGQAFASGEGRVGIVLLDADLIKVTVGIQNTRLVTLRSKTG